MVLVCFVLNFLMPIYVGAGMEGEVGAGKGEEGAGGGEGKRKTRRRRKTTTASMFFSKRHEIYFRVIKSVRRLKTT